MIKLLDAAKGFQHWEALLHVCQMLGHGVSVPPAAVNDAFRLLVTSTNHERPFIRAWAYSALAALAGQNKHLTGQVREILDSGKDDAAGSVRVRLRRASELLEPPDPAKP